MKPTHLALLGLTFCTLVLTQSEPALAQVVFTKAERVATGVLASFRGVLATAFFGIAFVVTEFVRAINLIDEISNGLVVIERSLVFAGPAIVANLRSSFS